MWHFSSNIYPNGHRKQKGLKSHIVTSCKANMALPLTLRIPLNHKGLSLHLPSTKPQADYIAYQGWMGPNLAALLIREFPAVGL